MKSMFASQVITGHALLEPGAPGAPLEFVQDEAILAKCRDGVDQLRRTHTAEAVGEALKASDDAELEAAGFRFFGGDA